MYNIYKNIVQPILTNEIIVNWIAPIITGLLVVAIPIFLSKFIRNKNLLKNIQETNNKIIDTIRPFIIQRIEINSFFISDIRNAIIKESNIKSKFIASEIEIRNKILLDISETRFLKENEKQDLINFTYYIFKDFNKKQLNLTKYTEDIKSNTNLNITKVIYTIILISSLIIMLIAYKINPVNTNIEDNIVIVLTMISSIFSMIFLSFNITEIGDIYNKSIFYSSSIKISDIIRHIDKITKKK